MGISNDSIHIFHHVYLTQHGLTIALQQLHLLSTSGLLNNATRLNVGIVYSDVKLKDSFVKTLKIYDIHNNINILFEHKGLNCDERVTGIHIKHFADNSNGNEKVLYIHTKGASRHDTKHETAINYWRQYLEYFNILNWRDCVDALNKNYDSCGVLWVRGDWKTIGKSGSHYSGSFYWVKSNLIKKIPLEHFSDKSMYGRYAMEALPSVVDHKALCLHKLDSSIVNPYHDVIHPKKYVDDNNIKKVQTEIITATPLITQSVKQNTTPNVIVKSSQPIDSMVALRDYINNSVNKKVVYTCITNRYDVLKEPLVVNDEWDYICFSDEDIKSNTWKIIRIPNDASEEVGQLVQRKLKILVHRYLSPYDISIWIDGNVQTKIDPETIYQMYYTKPFNTIAHPFRTCVYSEFDAVSSQRKDSPDRIERLKQKYLKEGYPKNHGLIQSNVIIRNHNHDSVIALANNWWKLMKEHSHRDQLTFNYVMWKFPNLSKHVSMFGANSLKNEFNFYQHGKNTLIDLPKNYGSIRNLLNGTYVYRGFEVKK